jgi:hypothetical protein
LSSAKGSIAELRFAIAARELGHSVLWPDDPESKFDLVIQKDGKFHRIQVKSTSRFRESSNGGDYYVTCRSQSGAYQPGDFDFLAALVEPTGTFYLIPLSEIRGTTLCLYPHRDNPNGVYEKFKEAWEKLS